MMRSISRSKARRSPSSENSFAASRDQIARECLVHVQQAEQVVEPVVEGVWIALDVEEQVAGRRRRQRCQPAIDVDLAARWEQELVLALRPRGDPPAGSVPARGRGRARPRRLPRAAAPSAAEVAERFEGGDAAHAERPPLAGRDPGDEAQVVVLAPPLRAFGRPAADVAVLDGLRVRRRRADRSAVSRRPASPGTGRGRSGSRPCSRRPAAARRCGRCRRGRRGATRAGRPGCARAGRRTSRSGGRRSP